MSIVAFFSFFRVFCGEGETNTKRKQFFIKDDSTTVARDVFNTSRLRQIKRNFADNIFRLSFMYESNLISI